MGVVYSCSMTKRKNVSQEFIDDSDDPDDEGVGEGIVKHGTNVLACLVAGKDQKEAG